MLSLCDRFCRIYRVHDREQFEIALLHQSLSLVSVLWEFHLNEALFGSGAVMRLPRFHLSVPSRKFSSFEVDWHTLRQKCVLRASLCHCSVRPCALCK